MIYEVRTYTLKPGSVAQWEENFAKALPVRTKHSELGGLWHTEIGPLNQVVHIWPYEDLQQRTEIRAKAAQETGWPPAGGDLLLNMESQIFIPAPFCPKIGGGQKLGNIYEMRIYQYQPGSIPTVIERWGEALQGGRLDLSPIAACMHSEIGGLNVWIHIWPYKDLAERARIRAESQKLDSWPPKTREFLVSQETKILVPAACSPMA
jgi:hypothetical protein